MGTALPPLLYSFHEISIIMITTLQFVLIYVAMFCRKYKDYPQPYMGITRSTLPQNNVDLPLPFFMVITLLFSWIIFIHYCIFILTGSTG